MATACAAGTHAVGDSFTIIQRWPRRRHDHRRNRSRHRPSSVAGFNAMKALSTRNDDPEKASRPFDRDRDGFVMGEGSGILILEALEHARRKRRPHLRRGDRLRDDRRRLPHDFATAGRQRRGSLHAGWLSTMPQSVRCRPVDYINAHGTSTELNDLYETRAIKSVFQEHASR